MGMKFEKAGDDRVEKFWPEVSRILDILGHPEETDKESQNIPL